MKTKLHLICLLSTLELSTLPARGGLVEISSCRAYCSGWVEIQTAGPAANAFQALQMQCPSKLMAGSGWYESTLTYAGSTTHSSWQGGRRYGSSTTTTTPIYQQNVYFNPGPAASAESNCSSQVIDTNVPQTHVGFVELQD